MQIKNKFLIKSLLFDNRTLKQTLFKNTFWLAFTEGVIKVLKLILFIYVARILGSEGYGKFSFALAFIGLFTILSTLGLPRIIVREFSQKKEKKEKEFISILSLKLLLSIGTLAIIAIGSFFITDDAIIRRIILILAVFTLIDSFTSFLNFFFQAQQKMEHESWTRIFRALVLTISGLLVILFFPSVENLSYSYLFSALIALIPILIFFHFKVYRLSFSLEKGIWKKYLLMSWPIAAAGIFSTIYGQIDSVIMGYLKQITETGWYNAAYRIMGAALIPVGFISTSFYPALSNAFQESKERFQKTWDYQMGLLIIFFVPVVVGGIVLAPKIINFIYGAAYLPATLAFQLLIVTVGFSFLQSPFNQALLILNREKKILWVNSIGVLVNVSLNLVLIPRFSLYGAALVMVITSLIILLLSIVFTHQTRLIKILDAKIITNTILILFSAFIMYLAISYQHIYNLNVVLTIILGSAVYFTVLLSGKFLIKYFSYYRNRLYE